MKEILEMNAPSYVYKGARGNTVIPLDSELLSERVILIDDTITSQTAVDFYKSMRFLAKTDEPIKVVICSGGGEVIAGQAIYDLMQGVKNEVHTYCIGRAASMAAVLLAAGTKGHRYILPHSEVMIHEVLIGGGVGGSATSISKISESINKTRDVMNGILAKHTGKTIEEINEATSFDNYMTAQQAVEFGICDKITDSVFEEVIA
jgi:ATP-dependent Clp protease protease subunit